MAEKQISILLVAKNLASGTIGKVSKDVTTLGKVSNRAGQGLRSLAGNLAKIGAVAAVGIGVAIKNGIDELAKTETAMAQTAAVLKSTGSAANVTAAGIDALTTSLQNTVAVEDDVVREAANLMLTFTNVRNEAGAGNDIFNQSITSLADMARAMGSDMPSAAVKLGKALNDPVKGMTALTKLGVTFTAEQKAEIQGIAGTGDALKNLKNAGIELTKKQKDLIKSYGPAVDTIAAAEGAHVKLTKAQRKVFEGMDDGTGIIKAQKIILAELNKEFGGSGAAYAKTYAGTMEGLGFAVEDAEKALAKGFMPVISKVSKFLQTQLVRPEVIKGIEDFGDVLAGFFDEAADFAMSIPWGTIMDTFSGIAGVAKTAVDAFKAIPTWAQQLLIGGFVANKLTGGAIGGIIGDAFKAVIPKMAIAAGIVQVNGPVAGGGGKNPVTDKLDDVVKTGGIIAAIKAALAATLPVAAVAAAGAAATGALLYGIPAIVKEIYGVKPEAGVNPTSARDPGFQATRQVNALLANVPRKIEATTSAVGDLSADTRSEGIAQRQALAALQSKTGETTTAVSGLKYALVNQKPPTVTVSVSVPVSVSTNSVTKKYTVQKRVGGGTSSRDENFKGGWRPDGYP